MNGEEFLTEESKKILAVLREEVHKGMLTEEQIELVEDALAVKKALGFIGSFVVKLAAVVGAGMALFAWWPRK